MVGREALCLSNKQLTNRGLRPRNRGIREGKQRKLTALPTHTRRTPDNEDVSAEVSAYGDMEEEDPQEQAGQGQVAIDLAAWHAQAEAHILEQTTDRMPDRVVIGAQRARSPTQNLQPEAIRTKLVKLPYPVSGEHIKTVFRQIQAYYDEHNFEEGTMPNFARCAVFADTLREGLFRYTPPGESQIVLRLGPPQNDTEKQKGKLATKLYGALDVGEEEGTLRTLDPPKMVINSVRPSGRLDQIANMELDSSGDELRTKSIHLQPKYEEKTEILTDIPRAPRAHPSTGGTRWRRRDVVRGRRVGNGIARFLDIEVGVETRQF